MTTIGRRTCAECAHELGQEDRFCAQCGTPAPAHPNDPAGPRIDLGRFFELAVDVFVVTGPDGKFVLVNEAMSRLLGVEREVILANPWSAFVHPDDRERSAEENAREFALGHRTITFENRYVDSAGGVHWMDWSAELDPDTGVVYGIARDVTEQRAARAALEEARATADEARAVADDARAGAERANEAKSEFLSRMSHELRTPLNAVLGFAQMLEMDAVDRRQLEYVEQIMRGGRHLLELIDEVLDISRIEMGAAAISVEPVSIDEIVGESTSLLDPLAGARQVALRVANAEVHAHYVMADRQRLRQVLVNYLSNAIKYTPPGSTATVSVTPIDGEWLRISVDDDGPGIPEPLLARLFQPFERIGADQTEVEGTGLGLVHSKALVERMGGRVGAASEVGRGSSFWLELRRAEQSAAAELTSGVPLVSARPDISGSILYIEDNPANLRLVERALEHRPGIRFLSAMLGRLGLALALEHQPDLILLDLNLPDISGEQVLAQLRSEPATSKIPVIIISADATRQLADRLVAQGALAYLTKPVDVRELLARIDDQVGPNESRGEGPG